ncbi:helix-turn-helix transcriptional regulator [Undibacterium jejuense]|uniref:helix-turn-helix transcriptional regulator n=1 Tax=Undibacterium jejuense TaxID=1344949 RepID=UPI001FEB3F03|nr:helix-turn-helix domain-containing protein [Undibacterium jejuense]
MSTNDLSNFDNLPSAAHVDVHTVAALFGCKTPTIWARLRRKEIPEPRRFGAHTRWNVGELRKALQEGRKILPITI